MSPKFKVSPDNFRMAVDNIAGFEGCCKQAATLKTPGTGSMSSIKRNVKKKVLPRPEAEKILFSRSSPLPVRVPLDLRERFCF
jgi:hypothetical protein